MIFTLLLSHKTDSVQHSISGKILDKLEPYHLLPIRFIYKCFRTKQKGVILSEDRGMSFELQISAFLQSICTDLKLNSPVLVICTENTLFSWNYHISKYSGLETFILNDHNAEDLFSKYEKCVILVKQTQIKILQKYKETEFFSVIAEECENIANTKLFNDLRGNFNIALTYKNFYKNRDQKIMWKIMRWADSGSVGKLTEFCETDNFHLNNLSDPYSDLIFRQTWEFCPSFKKPTSDEIESLNEEIEKWSKDNNFIREGNSKPRKRKSTTKQIQVSKKGKTEKKISKRHQNAEYCSDEELGKDVSELEDQCSSSHLVSKEVSYLFNSTVKNKFVLALSSNKKKVSTVSKNIKDSLSEKPVDNFSEICQSNKIYFKHNDSKTIKKRVSDSFVFTSFSDDKFEAEHAKKRKSLPSHKSLFNLGNNLPKIDKNVLKEFSKNFQLEQEERKKKIRTNNIEILNNVSIFFESSFDKSLTGSGEKEIVGLREESNQGTIKVSDKIPDIQMQRLFFTSQEENFDSEIKEILEEIITKVLEESDIVTPNDKVVEIDSDNENSILLNIIHGKPKVNVNFTNDAASSSAIINDEDDMFFKNLLSKNDSSNHNIGFSCPASNDTNDDIISSLCDTNDEIVLEKKRFNITDLDCNSDDSSSDILTHSDKDDFFKKFCCRRKRKDKIKAF